MVRGRVSTDLERCRAMLTLLKRFGGTEGGIRNPNARGTYQLWTILGPRTTGYAVDLLRPEENRTILPCQIHSFCKALFTMPGARLQSLEENSCIPLLPYAVRSISVQTALSARQRTEHDEQSQKGMTKQEDPFDSITDKIPERPVTVAEGASYSVVILLGLAVAGAAAYAVFKELVFEPKEYKVFGKALERVQHDSQVSARLGAPITGYGQESRNRAARQRISNRAWTDEAGTERIEVMFHIRGPGGAGKVYSEMFKDPQDKTWKYTYLIVDVTSPTPKRLMLESYVPPLNPLSTL